MEFHFLALIFFIAMLIPLGTMYKPMNKKNQSIATKLTLAIFITGILGLATLVFTGNAFVFYVSAFGIFAYQWIINGMMIKEASRKF